MIERILDKLGQEITPGSIIVYGHALGQSAGLRIGKVIRVEMKPDAWNSKKLSVHIIVHGVNDDCREPALCKKKGTLMFPDRTIVLDPAKVPAEFSSLLEQIV